MSKQDIRQDKADLKLENNKQDLQANLDAIAGKLDNTNAEVEIMSRIIYNKTKDSVKCQEILTSFKQKMID